MELWDESSLVHRQRLQKYVPVYYIIIECDSTSYVGITQKKMAALYHAYITYWIVKIFDWSLMDSHIGANGG